MVIADTFIKDSHENFFAGFKKQKHIEQIKEKLPILNACIKDYVELIPEFENNKIKSINYKSKFSTEEVDQFLNRVTDCRMVVDTTASGNSDKSVLLAVERSIDCVALKYTYDYIDMDMSIESALSSIRYSRLNKLHSEFETELNRTTNVDCFSPKVRNAYDNLKEIEKEIILHSSGISKDPFQERERTVEYLRYMFKKEMSYKEIPDFIKDKVRVGEFETLVVIFNAAAIALRN